ncbi:hypothetical protein [Chitinophaga sp.]|uniref:hypothetical protein n=1 Tax=Chitinophaga sp. TaxID=1869181 RepID=UPI002F932A23
MDEWEYQEMKQAFRKRREFLEANPGAVKEWLDSIGVGNLFSPKKDTGEVKLELMYPCTAEYMPVDLSVFLCD